MPENKLLETERNILGYVQENADKIGRIREPITLIAEKTGLSTATVHRALRALEQRNLIRIIPSDVKTMPNIVQYLGGRPESHDTFTQGYTAVEQIHFAFNTLESILKEREHEIEDLRLQCQEYERRLSEVEKEIVLPDGTRMLVLKKLGGV